MQGTIDECLATLFEKSNNELIREDVNYNTLASWRYQFAKDGLSTEKKRQILTTYGYALKTQEKWHKRMRR